MGRGEGSVEGGENSQGHSQALKIEEASKIMS